MKRDGMYATFQGETYSANLDATGQLVITSSDPAALRHGFVDRYGVGTYTRAVEPTEVTDLHRTRHIGTYDDLDVSLSVNARGGVLVGTREESVAERLGLARIDKLWWEVEVAPDDPRLRIVEVDEPLADPAGTATASVDVDRYFTRLNEHAVPLALLRRHFTADGYEDQVLRAVDDWKPDAHRSVSKAIIDALESDLIEITPEQAAEFKTMVSTTEYRRFPK